MADIKYVGEAAVGRIADYVNKKLAFVSSMPESPDTNTVILYIGADTSSYMQGGIYKYDGNNWILINNNVKQLSLTQEEYDLLPTSVQNNGTEYFVTNGVGPLENNIIQGYYNTADGKFYRDSSFAIEITGNSQILYIDLLTNKTYRYDSINIEYILIGGSSYENKPAQENGTDLSLVTTGEKYEWNKQVDWNQSDNTKKDFLKNKPDLSTKADLVNGKVSSDQLPTLGTASALNVASSGNAGINEVVKGNDTRLSDARNAADVYSWAKESTKPTYTASEVGAIASTDKGANNGVAELDSTGKVPSSQLPSYVDDVLEYNSQSAFPSTGETGKIYIAKDTNKTYRWSGTAYVEISESLALGETSSTAYAGNKGKANADAISGILDGTSIDSFGDVETVLADKIGKSQTAGLLKNDGTIDTNAYVKKNGGDISDTELNSIPIIPDLYPDEYINAGYDFGYVTGAIKKFLTDLRDNKAELSSIAPAYDSTKTYAVGEKFYYVAFNETFPGEYEYASCQLYKVKTSCTGITPPNSAYYDVINIMDELAGKADKVSNATSGNFAGLDSNGNLTDSGKKADDFLTSHQTIKQDGVTGATINRFGTCNSAASAFTKTVSITSGTFSLEKGARITVLFANANTVTSGGVALDVNSTGAKVIKCKGQYLVDRTGILSGVKDFVYDGSNWILMNDAIPIIPIDPSQAEISLFSAGSMWIVTS